MRANQQIDLWLKDRTRNRKLATGTKLWLRIYVSEIVQIICNFVETRLQQNISWKCVTFCIGIDKIIFRKAIFAVLFITFDTEPFGKNYNLAYPNNRITTKVGELCTKPYTMKNQLNMYQCNIFRA